MSNCTIDINLTQGKQSQLNSEISPIIREGQKLYEIKEGNKTLQCHADVNGSMNIVRKFIPKFNIKTLKSYERKQIFAYRIVKLENYAVGKNMFTDIRK